MKLQTRLYLKSSILLMILLLLMLFSCKTTEDINLIASPNDLHFDDLSKVWDEAIPLGNGMLGTLIWEKEGKLRFSLDRADLWDLRPKDNLKTPEWKYSWVYEQWKKDNYKPVQDLFDKPYGSSPAPSKIPGAALEFDISSLGEVASVHLYIEEAICEVKWKNGVKLQTFVHATEPIGWYKFEGLEKALSINLIPPAYTIKGKSNSEDAVTGQDLRRLGYPEGEITKNENAITYEQDGWGGFKYQVYVTNVINVGTLEGSWSISSEFPGWDKKPSATETIAKNKEAGISKALDTHKDWWDDFWSKSNIQLPDTILQKQWHLEQYKFGSAARVGAPPISLQAVWTADNGRLPPWKGDYHHDLNTQLSYWPAYSGNHLDLENGFLEWLLENKETFKKYTKEYYESEGLNVPGVSTLTGEPMGGWIQFAFGPTVSGWLGQHFYLHWRYSMDEVFLKEKAYPWIKDVAIYFEDISIKNDEGFRKLPISSSPEIHNNSREAWFGETTNFDLAIIRWTYEKAAELALELGNKEEAKNWTRLLDEWPNFAIDETEGLMLAPKHPYATSHRHFSHLLAIHPLGLIDYSKGENDQIIVDNTINNLLEKGSDQFTGYSFSWLGNLQARAFDGEGAVKTLRIFSENFCLPNSFHVNGEQHNKGYSQFKYRPFTLEGNFAFASAIQEMLIQSHTGVVKVFPAIPESWNTLSFDQLRTEGAFLISAKKENGQVTNIKITSEKGGLLKLKNPFGTSKFKTNTEYKIENEIISIKTNPKQEIEIGFHE